MARSFGDVMRDIGRALGIGGGGQASSGGGNRASSGGGQARPSIVSVGSNQRMATVDLPRYGISAGQVTTNPSYGAFSWRGLTSTDPANVMRNLQRPAQQAVIAGGDRGGRDRDRPTTPTTPATPVAPPTPPTTPEVPPVAPPPTPPRPPAPVNPSDMTSTGPSEDLALESASQGLASTILTSGQGIAEEEPGLLRPRRGLGRSLVGRGLIQ